MILVDANIVISAIAGDYVARVLTEARERGVSMAVPVPQLAEALRVLVGKLDFTEAEAQQAVQRFTALVPPVGAELYAEMEQAARARLHKRGQSDWPVLAAALASAGGIWSHDRDFFGVGVPVWSSPNIQYAT